MATKILDPGATPTTSTATTVSSGERVTLYLSGDATAGNGFADILFETAPDTYTPVFSMGWYGERTAAFEGPCKFQVRGTAGVYRA